MNAIKDAIWVILDNEGPLTKNDNAQENTVALAAELEKDDPVFWERIAPEIVIDPTPDEVKEEMTLGQIIGARFFHGTSNIDDAWGDFKKLANIDPTYSAGHTLKVILPFYKAMGATSQWLYEFAKSSLLVVPNISKVLAWLDQKYNVWQVSTSYEFFIRAFCETVGFDFSRTYCTFVPKFDDIPITEEEVALLLAFMKEVAAMPIIEYNSETGEIIPEHQRYYDRFSIFVWSTVYNMPVGKLLQTVHPVGQTQKREALEEICRRFNVPKEKVMYVGDSQTDVQCVEWLKGEGLTMMFNCKGRVCRLSDLMYVGEDARAIEYVADYFTTQGKQKVLDYYMEPRGIQGDEVLATVTSENAAGLEEKSVKKRKEFRGVHIGELT